MNIGMTVLSEMTGFQKIHMTDLSGMTGLDNQSIACTRSSTSISWWIILFRAHTSSLTWCAEMV
jgi:hypothetical protein